MPATAQPAPDTHRAARTSAFPGEYMAKLDRFLERGGLWLPWLLAALYCLAWGLATFRYHTVGGFGVETDFYAELVPQARDLLAGQFSPLTYGSKGPVYSVTLSLVFLVVRDFFTAGIVINLAGAFVFLGALHILLGRLFNRTTALLTVLAIMLNRQFQLYTWQAGSDLFFMALAVMSLLFIYRSNSVRDIVLAAIYALLAFLTRYNGAFLIPGSILILALRAGTGKERLRNLLIWCTVFVVTGLPWFIPNAIATSNPVHNDNYINVALDFYGLTQQNFNYEHWTDEMPPDITDMGSLIRHDPLFFITHFGWNLVNHALRDVQSLVGLRFAPFLLLGLLLLPFLKPAREKLIYWSFGVVLFAILALVFYNERFGLFLLTQYLTLAIWPLTQLTMPRFRLAGGVGVMLVALTVASCAVTEIPASLAAITKIDPLPEGLKKLGLALARVESDPTQRVMARMPHIAHYAGLRPFMLPATIDTVENLVTYCQTNGIRYIAYTAIELQTRPALKVLFDAEREFPGLAKIVTGPAGVVFRVTDIPSEPTTSPVETTSRIER